MGTDTESSFRASKHLAPGVACLLLAACSALVDADAFSVGHAEPMTPLCERCPGSVDSRQPPCRPTGGDGVGSVAFFAVRKLDFGHEQDTWVDGYHAGMDLDCSKRPDGKPVQCKPRAVGEAVVPLPHGVDNGFAQSVIRPIAMEPGFALGSSLAEALELGQGGLLLILDGWNGSNDDPGVGVRLVATQSTTDGLPARWDGTDRWVAFATSWDTNLPGVPTTSYNETRTGYVADGWLVWDVRERDTLRLTLQSRGAVFRLDLRDGVLLGRLDTTSTPARITEAQFAGTWSLNDAERHAGALGQLAGGCDSALWCPLESAIRERLDEAADMLLPFHKDEDASLACDGISVGIAVEMEETGGVDQLVDVAAPSCGGMNQECPP